MHAQWRLHRQFLMWCAQVVNNKQVVEDFSVSEFNKHRFFFLDVVTTACAEYLNFLGSSAGAPSFDDPAPILARADANIDLAWVCHFLHDAGFFVLDFLQAVRSNDSKTLDLLWREFFASAHTGTANKTQYVPMSIMRVFWGFALSPELDRLYHNIRTIPSGDFPGSGVGWDMAIEMLNAAIKAHVEHQVSHIQIGNFLRNWALLECVQQRLKAYIYGGRNRVLRSSHSVDARPDVDRLLGELKKVVGATWAQATAPNVDCQVTVGHQRSMRPWVEVAQSMRGPFRKPADAPHAQIRKHVETLTSFYNWMPE